MHTFFFARWYFAHKQDWLLVLYHVGQWVLVLCTQVLRQQRQCTLVDCLWYFASQTCTCVYFTKGGTLPAGTLPGVTLPAGTLPAGTLLGGTLPVGTLHTQFVCKILHGNIPLAKYHVGKVPILYYVGKIPQAKYQPATTLVAKHHLAKYHLVNTIWQCTIWKSTNWHSTSRQSTIRLNPTCKQPEGIVPLFL